MPTIVSCHVNRVFSGSSLSQSSFVLAQVGAADPELSSAGVIWDLPSGGDSFTIIKKDKCARAQLFIRKPKAPRLLHMKGCTVQSVVMRSG